MDTAVLTPPQSTEVRALFDLLATLKDPDAHAQRLQELNDAVARHNESIETLRLETIKHQQALRQAEASRLALSSERSQTKAEFDRVHDDLTQREAKLKAGNESLRLSQAEIRTASADVTAMLERAREKERKADERHANLNAREAQFGEAQQRHREEVLKFQAKVKAVQDLSARLSQP